MAKKVGKGKKKKNAGPEPVTTVTILDERSKMLCPRLGDIYPRTALVENILEEVCAKVIEKAVTKESTFLHLNAMKLEKIPELLKLSGYIQSITELDLSKNHLFNGDHLFQQISHLGQLSKLNLSHNFLNGNLSSFAGTLVNLEELNLDVNQIVNLTPVVGNWTKLRVFSIADNSISLIPAECSSWKNIESVDFRNNKVIDIPGALFSSWKSLKKIYMGFNLLKKLPIEVGECVELCEAEFSNNSLEHLPISLANCHKLEQLHLGCNKIAEIPAEILTGLSHLKELQLYKNKITSVPPEIGNLMDLERMSIASNNIRRVPEEIGTCINLRELYLSNNKKLAVIPNSTGHLRSLKELSLRKCPALRQLPPSIANLGDLKELDLRALKKQVCKITPEIVDALKKNRCVIRGGVVKKGKAKKGKKAAS